MKKILLKDGQEVYIREAVKEDAKAIIDFYNFVGGETDFLSFGKNEYVKNIQDYECLLDNTRNEKNSIILLAEMKNKIIGIASICSSPKVRYKHTGEFGIVIEQKYWGLGLGKQIMENIINWAKDNGITRKINLVTNENNYRAIDLYKKIGFEVEGILKNNININGVYGNTIMMGLQLKQKD